MNPAGFNQRNTLHDIVKFTSMKWERCIGVILWIKAFYMKIRDHIPHTASPEEIPLLKFIIWVWTLSSFNCFQIIPQTGNNFSTVALLQLQFHIHKVHDFVLLHWTHCINTRCKVEMFLIKKHQRSFRRTKYLEYKRNTLDSRAVSFMIRLIMRLAWFQMKFCVPFNNHVPWEFTLLNCWLKSSIYISLYRWFCKNSYAERSNSSYKYH